MLLTGVFQEIDIGELHFRFGAVNAVIKNVLEVLKNLKIRELMFQKI